MFGLRSRASAPAIYLVKRGVTAFAFGLIVTVLSLLYIQVAGMDPLQLVLVGTVLEATYLVLEIPTGALADTYSRRLSVIIGTAIVGLTFVGEALLPVFVAIVVCEAVRGVGEAFLSGAEDAWIAGEVGDDAIGPLFVRGHQIAQAGWLLSIVASVALGSIDLRIPVVLGGALFVLLAGILVIAMPERGFTRTRDQRRSWTKVASTARQGTRVMRAQPVLLMLAAITFFAGAASEGHDRLEEIHFLSNLGLPTVVSPVVWFGIISFGGSLISIAAVQLVRRRLLLLLADDRAMARALAAFQALRIVGQLAFAWAPGFAIGLTGVWSQALLTSGPVMNAWTIRQIDPSVRATVLSMNGTLSAIGQIAGGPPVGVLGSTVGIRAALTASALLLAPTVALFHLAGRRRSPVVEEVVAASP